MTADLLEGIGTLPPPERRFDGETYFPQLDCQRLTGQLARVASALSDRKWWCLSRLAEAAGCSEASASARLRDMRKLKFGAHKIERRRIMGGLFAYRLAR